jgi:deazaflavin-dependent oxidoreductase (nitroreductase family)
MGAFFGILAAAQTISLPSLHCNLHRGMGLNFTGCLRRLIFSLAASRQGMWMFHVFVRLIDIPISRLSGGAFIPSALGNVMPIYFLSTLGARSRQPRSQPVLCIPMDGLFILVGSNWGNSRNPAWVYNLRVHPRGRICKGKINTVVIARELQGDERRTYWQKATAFYPPYESYEQRSGRTLPVFILVPAAGNGSG